MRVLTLNIHGWQTASGEANLDLIGALLRDCHAHVVTLNEVWHPWPGDGEPALAMLAQRLGMSFAFGLVAPARSPNGKTLPYGNALLTRWPIVAYASHRLPSGSYRVPRGLLEVRLASPSGRTVTIYVTHLDHRSEAARLEQWNAAQAWLGREGSNAHVLSGDFNALAASDYGEPQALQNLAARQAERGWPAPVFDLTGRILGAGYVDAFASAGQGPGATWPSHEPERRVDYIFAPAAAAPVISCTRWDGPCADVASDHRPVLADIAFD